MRKVCVKEKFILEKNREKDCLLPALTCITCGILIVLILLLAGSINPHTPGSGFYREKTQ